MTYTLRCQQRTLLVDFPTPQRVVSWAIHNGGPRQASQIAWVGVRNADLPLGVDPLDVLQQRLQQVAARPDAVGMLTSRNLERYVVTEAEHDGQRALCVATVGLSNALRAGDLPGPFPSRVGTINLLVWLSIPLSSLAQLEALALASEAKALAVREGEVPSRNSGQPASGTGTDCAVVACPNTEADSANYAGKHTLAGHLVAKVTHEAVAEGVAEWLAEYVG